MTKSKKQREKDFNTQHDRQRMLVLVLAVVAILATVFSLAHG